MTTFIQTQTAEELQLRLAEAYRDVPEWQPTNEDLCRMAAEFDERRSEGRIMRPFRTNPHD